MGFRKNRQKKHGRAKKIDLTKKWGKSTKRQENDVFVGIELISSIINNTTN